MPASRPEPGLCAQSRQLCRDFCRGARVNTDPAHTHSGTLHLSILTRWLQSPWRPMRVCAAVLALAAHWQRRRALRLCQREWSCLGIASQKLQMVKFGATLCTDLFWVFMMGLDSSNAESFVFLFVINCLTFFPTLSILAVSQYSPVKKWDRWWISSSWWRNAFSRTLLPCLSHSALMFILLICS